MPRAKKAKSTTVPDSEQDLSDIAKRFPDLSQEKQLLILDAERRGWTISKSEDNKFWNASYPDVDPTPTTAFSSLDTLLAIMSAQEPISKEDFDEYQTAKNKGSAAAENPASTIVARVEWPDDMLYPVDLLTPSPTNPRKRFPAGSITELAGSIREQGIIEPLIVRQRANSMIPPEYYYEIVCGERRWRSAQEAGETRVPAHVRDLTDEQVLEIQIHENLHREDVHPLDEALGYRSIQETLGCDMRELAARVGKDEKYVRNRLKLNQLIEAAQNDLDAGYLPLTYALEISKYGPSAQAQILENAVYRLNNEYKNGKWINEPVKTTLQHLSSMQAWIVQNILYQLAKAPFDTKATNLRTDGLACVKCPSRTGANAGLFDVDVFGKKDSCLDPECYREKTKSLIAVTREKIAHEACIETEQVPVIDSRIYTEDVAAFGGKAVEILSSHKAVVIGAMPKGKHFFNTSAKTCENSVTAVDVDRDNYAGVLTVCLASSKCKVHWETSSSASSTKPKSEKAEAAAREQELDQKRVRREEIWNCNVGEEVRRRIFGLAAAKFTESFAVTGAGDSFVAAICAKLWDLYGNDYIKRRVLDNVARPIIAGYMDVAESKVNFTSGSSDGGDRTERNIRLLSENVQKRLLYILIHGQKGDMGGGSWASQRSVLEIATEWGLNYRLVDAQVRVELSSKKQLEVHKTYLATVEADKEADIPWIFSPNWKRRD